MSENEKRCLGNYRKSLRARRGLTQQAVADSAGLNLKTVQAAERGDDLMVSSAIAIARALTVTLDAYATVPDDLLVEAAS
jgi:transcriptional regulator with XRE-family HTH domain